MKRAILSTLFVAMMLITISANSLGFSLLGATIDAYSNPGKVVINMEGDKVYLGGSTLGSLKKTLNKYDFEGLEHQTRKELYEKAQVSINWPVWKNLLIGFGSGSKLQGDIGGELFGQIADWTAATTVGVGVGMYLVDLFLLQIFTSSSTADDPLKELAVGTMLVGAIFFGVERVIQALLPIPYGIRYNNALRNGLKVNKDGSDRITLGFSVTPLEVMAPNEGLQVQFVGKLSFSM